MVYGSGTDREKKQDMIFSSYSWQFVRPLKLNEYQVDSQTRGPLKSSVRTKPSQQCVWYYFFYRKI